MTDTRHETLRANEGGRHGYRTLHTAPAEVAVRRPEATGPPPAGLTRLVRIAHLSDLHVCDSQSPARVELLDRWADPDSPLLDQLGEVGTYRAQEILTVQVVEAMVQAINEIDDIDFAVVTGDNADNAQRNELDWYLSLLEGGPVWPDSGDLSRYEGVADGERFDERFWHPEDARPDLPRARFGFPTVPGLLDAVRAPFHATGLNVPWLAVHGNHDRLLQGTLVAEDPFIDALIGTAKPIELPAYWSTEAVLTMLVGLAECDPAAIRSLADLDTRTVTADPARRTLGPAEFIQAHLRPTARPAGHGFTDGDAAYYRHDHGRVTMLTLDTVNPNGGWQGSLDPAQAEWLVNELVEADREQRYVILASHHPLETMVNANGGSRYCEDDVAELLAGHPSLVAWLAGHTHTTAVRQRPGYWQIVTPSLIDFPQQGRIVDLARGDGTLVISATMIDHHGSAPWSGDIDSISALAGLSRELAVNDWQVRHLGVDEHPRAGARTDRNVELMLRDPFGA